MLTIYGRCKWKMKFPHVEHQSSFCVFTKEARIGWFYLVSYFSLIPSSSATTSLSSPMYPCAAPFKNTSDKDRDAYPDLTLYFQSLSCHNHCDFTLNPTTLHHLTSTTPPIFNHFLSLTFPCKASNRHLIKHSFYSEEISYPPELHSRYFFMTLCRETFLSKIKKVQKN